MALSQMMLMLVIQQIIVCFIYVLIVSYSLNNFLYIYFIHLFHNSAETFDKINLLNRYQIIESNKTKENKDSKDSKDQNKIFDEKYDILTAKDLANNNNLVTIRRLETKNLSNLNYSKL